MDVKDALPPGITFVGGLASQGACVSAICQLGALGPGVPVTMVITGTVVGDVTCTSLVITERGIVHGSIRADDATILGEVNGEIYATILTLKTASSVTGDIYHKQLTLEDGCYFEGRSRRHNTPLLLAS